jgi:hypothetical protein
MRECWPIWSAPTGITTGRGGGIRGWPRRSRCWPAAISSWSGLASDKPTSCAALRAFYPAALVAVGGDPGGRDAVAVLQLAPTPELGRALPHAELVAALRCAGRRRQVEARAVGNRRLTTACHLWALRP